MRHGKNQHLRIVSYSELPKADLLIDAVYEGRAGSHLSGEALSKLLPGIGNQGGFRASGRGIDKKFVVLFTSGEDLDWPDSLDSNTGELVYFGDNKTPGHALHDTERGGNRILRRVFDLLHGDPPRREEIPPFLIFQKQATMVSTRSFRFKGLAAPGFPGVSATSDLVAVWKSYQGQRFQNYRAVFTILNAPLVERRWLKELLAGDQPARHAPLVWRDWVGRGHFEPLAAESTTMVRNTAAQLPDSLIKRKILEVVWNYFKEAPHSFEAFATLLFQMHDSRVIIDQITRASVDGGRDAIGRYRLGLKEDPVYVEFSLEAKCYRPGLGGASATSVGVKDISRLISRLRHRQFGVLVTTSVVGLQAYEEVRQDKHPIIFFSGKDIADVLVDNGLNTPEAVEDLLKREFPKAEA
jgi:hypothetical protein